MVPDPYHDFFVASASAAGALVGLLFVALSIWQGRDDDRAQIEAHSLRASAALTVFSNALVISLFALLPGDSLGETTTIVGVLGAGSVVGSTLRLLRLRRAGVAVRGQDTVFVIGGAVLFAWQLENAVRLWVHPSDHGLVGDIAVIVVISFTYGIARSWELIGGPEVGMVSEMSRLLRDVPLDADGEAKPDARAKAGADPEGDVDVDTPDAGRTGPEEPTRGA